MSAIDIAFNLALSYYYLQPWSDKPTDENEKVIGRTGVQEELHC